ncbi:MAG: hypothetical protein ACR2M0_03740 [Chloroflexia bacterium]
MNNRMMIVRVLFLLVILLGVAMLANLAGDPGLGSPVTWVHILAGLAAFGLIESRWATASGREALTGQMMIVRVMFLAVVLLAIAQLYDLTGPSGLASPVTWLHILAGLALIALFERLWASRRSA